MRGYYLHITKQQPQAQSQLLHQHQRNDDECPHSMIALQETTEK
nr:hypothetical protein [Enterobacter cloacae complex sp.]QVQ60273.1 hypothetical protein [Enterobacter cloacae complex sp.]